jgi:hypothetical protein
MTFALGIREWTFGSWTVAAAMFYQKRIFKARKRKPQHKRSCLFKQFPSAQLFGAVPGAWVCLTVDSVTGGCWLTATGLSVFASPSPSLVQTKSLKHCSVYSGGTIMFWQLWIPSCMVTD